LAHQDVDQVRITGGTGQMPLIQNKLIDLFGKDKIEMSEVFQSVVHGLGKYALGL
jgi:molecular chaperone DnaK (HSP70)